VRELNKKLEDIRKEQQFQREREHDFRTLSDKVNWRTTWWSVLQISVLVGTCAWQLRTLRVSPNGVLTPLAVRPGCCRILAEDTPLTCPYFQTWFHKQKLI
jgi:hypothetical protein